VGHRFGHFLPSQRRSEKAGLSGVHQARLWNRPDSFRTRISVAKTLQRSEWRCRLRRYAQTPERPKFVSSGVQVCRIELWSHALPN
jgi:hypothetical protein